MTAVNPALKDLPLHLDRKASRSPVSEPLLIHLAVEAWYSTNGDEFAEHAIPEAGPYRASYAGKRCNRALAYAMAGVEPSEPFTIADKWRFALGTIVHDLASKGAQLAFPDSKDLGVDEPLDLREIGIPGSGRGDLILRLEEDGEVVVIANEWKTKSGFPFKKAMGANNNSAPAEGPSYGDIVQGALAAAVTGAHQLRVGYISMEIISPGNAKKLGLKTDIDRFAAEWVYPKSVIDTLVAAERDRVAAVLAYDDPNLVPRELVDPEYLVNTIVQNPATGRTNTYDGDGEVIDTGRTWMCDYCSWQTTCTASPQ